MSSVYTKAKEYLLAGAIDLSATGATPIHAALVTGTYTPNFNTDEFYSAIPGGEILGSVALASKTVTGGVFDAADVQFVAPQSGKSAAAVVLYVNTGTAATSKLIAYIDTITGFPFTTSGSNVTVEWDNGANKILAL